jgi:peptidoglycan/xylan/chitin deacetylase (PgdA/CDA1 family)
VERFFHGDKETDGSRGRQFLALVHRRRLEKGPESESPSGRGASLFDLTLPGVPIFNYHGLAESISDEASSAAAQFCLPPTKFRTHLAHIRGQSFQTALLDDLKGRTEGSQPKLRRVVLSFDDGIMTDYEKAFPLLVEFGMRAVFFLNTATIGQVGYLNWDKIVEMHRHGMSIQSHSHHHVDLTVLPTPALDVELSESKRRIEDRLGSRVDFLAAPHGVLDRRVVRRALAVGYRSVCSTRCWPARPGSTILTRITLRREVQIQEFHGFLTGKLWSYARRLSRGLLHRPQAIAGHLGGVLRHRLLKQPVTVSK